MASILMGAATALIILIAGAGCFIAGLKAIDIKISETEPKSRPAAEPTEEQRKIAEGLSNMLNYGNRHKIG